MSSNDCSYILHNLGLGDHIICNGMVRHIYKNNKNIKLFCFLKNKKNVERMYRDLSNIKLIVINHISEAIAYIKKHNLIKQTFNSTRFDLSRDNPHKDRQTGPHDRLWKYISKGLTFDEAFYRILNLDFSIRFDEFHIERDRSNEYDILSKLNPLNKEFVFIHDDQQKGFNVDDSKIESSYLKIRNDPSFCIFDYVLLLEKSKEVHAMESSFKNLVNSIKLKNTKLFFHEYVRRNTRYIYGNKAYNSKGVNEWKTLT